MTIINIIQHFLPSRETWPGRSFTENTDCIWKDSVQWSSKATKHTRL